jgi:antitoxin (DNA-binding transcriptional repressor) of toxin-antitoxin stability system
MAVTASELRQNIYRLLDEVLETGKPLEIERKGRRLRIVALEPERRLDRVRPRPDVIVGDPDDLVSIDWSATWSGAVDEPAGAEPA